MGMAGTLRGCSKLAWQEFKHRDYTYWQIQCPFKYRTYRFTISSVDVWGNWIDKRIGVLSPNSFGQTHVPERTGFKIESIIITRQNVVRENKEWEFVDDFRSELPLIQQIFGRVA